jgi:hypothetical protein
VAAKFLPRRQVDQDQFTAERLLLRGVVASAVNQGLAVRSNGVKRDRVLGWNANLKQLLNSPFHDRWVGFRGTGLHKSARGEDSGSD